MRAAIRMRFRRPRRSTLVLATVFLVFVGAFPNHAQACQCMEASVQDHLRDADVVIAGEIVNVSGSWRRGDASETMAIARVETIFKGDVGRVVKIYYVTKMGSRCRVWLRDGDSGVFLLYSVDDDFTVRHCDPILTSESVVKVLGEGSRP